jgi:cysteine-rich repeat protein
MAVVHTGKNAGGIGGKTEMRASSSDPVLRIGRLLAAAACFLICAATAFAAGDPCILEDNGTGTVTLPPQGCDYRSPQETFMIIDGLPPGTTIELDPIHRDFLCLESPGSFCSLPLPPGGCETQGGSLDGDGNCFESLLELQVAGTGSLVGFNRTLWVPVTGEVHTGARNPGDPMQSFVSEIYRLQGELFGDPDFCTFRLTGGRDYGLPSPGEMTLTQLPSGDFNVYSYFDFTYQLEFEGCPVSQLDGYMGTTTATLRIETGNECGNNVVETGEQCDDGNTENCDGCSATCTLEEACACLGGDTDEDTLCDDEDPCQHHANTLPLVISGFSGIPDECLCGDFDGDGFHSATDAAAINDCAAFISSDCVPERDEVSEPVDGFYSATDADLVNRVAAFLDPAYTLTCPRRPEGTCGGDTGVSCF